VAVWKNRFAAHLGLRAPDLPLFLHLGGDADPVGQVELLADLGFAGAQDNYLTLRTPEMQSRIGDTIARRGMVMGSFVHDPLHWNQPCWSGDAAALDRAFETTLAAAQRSGSRRVNCVTGFDSTRSRADQLLAMGRNLRRAADRAAKTGIVLCIEVTNPVYLPGMLIESLDEAVRLIDAIDHPAVRLMFDTGHLAMNGENIPAIIKTHARRIGAVQVADVAKNGATRVDLGAGKLDWPPILRALRDIGYGGLLEVEHQPLDDSREGEVALLARLRAVDARA